MPITRAAWTYSLFFSTIVEPRTVRAYCTQLAAAIAKISTNERDARVRVARQHRARDAVDQQRDQDRRKRELHVGDAHDERVELAAGVAGDEAERHAERRRRARPTRADQQRNARAEHDRRQHVAALVVGAEQVAWLRAREPRRRRERIGEVERRAGRTDCAARPMARTARREAEREHDRRDDRHRGVAEAPRDVAVPCRWRDAPPSVARVPALRRRRRIVHAVTARVASSAASAAVARLRVAPAPSSRRCRCRTRRASAAGSPRADVAGASGWLCSQWSARSASSMSRSGSVPYSSAIAAYVDAGTLVVDRVAR